MAGWLRRRIQDGIKARLLLSRLLLGVDGYPVRLGSDDPFVVASISASVLLEKIALEKQMVSRVGGLVFIGWAGWIAFGS